ncbi:TPA: V-type ATP synthase subunit F [Candidatus Woesearchaeota archaeon]|nr:V-type ATP synthase subunit F [Candidatus Woesearchaeota archaeon]HII68714.1 V-type ATP synthase subunit F [Candidatus Woesearchaeota archaeon]
MAELAVIGNEEFTLGFQLAGIAKAVNCGGDHLAEIRKLREDQHIGVIIIDEKILDGLDYHDRADIESSVAPVFVALSDTASQDNLRKLVKKSIGVDLWQDSVEEEKQ